MGRESENLPLARASRPSVAGAARRVPRSADYTGGRLSFGNERAGPLVFPAQGSPRAQQISILLQNSGEMSMTSWAERASASLLPLSLAHTLAATLKEWAYTGRFFDLETTDGTCELCGQQELRYHFEIENGKTDASLLVGSECIKRFEIMGIDEQGRRLDATETGKLVDRHRRGLVEDARKQRVMTALLKLGHKLPDFDAHNFIDFVDDKGAFTPNQVAMIFWRMGSAGVEYGPTDWKVRLRRDSDLNQLRTMKPAALTRVMAALTTAQRQRVEKINANFAEHRQRWR